MKSQEMEKGTTLLRKGDRGEVFYLVEEGEIKIFADTENTIPLSVIGVG